MEEYLSKNLKTRLNKNIDERDILVFDQNFECGNLDSVYLHDQYEYNLLLKVDSNTKGNTYWFMFKVSGFCVGLTYRFNILNFTRDLATFYSKGMNLVTKAENQKGEDKNKVKFDKHWRYGQCKNVEFHTHGDVPRNAKKNQQTNENIYTRYFSKLSFTYTFKEEDRGSKVVFAYAIPYSYTDLLVDLHQVKQNLTVDDSFVLYEDLSKADGVDQKTGEKAEILRNVSPHNSKENDPVSPNSNIQGQGQGGSQNRLKNSPNKPLTQFQMQSMTIQRQGKESIKVNQFEQNFFNQSRYQKKFALGQDQDEQKGSKQNNFEITNKTIKYRQEVLTQSICGLNIYQLTITKRKDQSMKQKKKTVIYIQARLHAAETHGSIIMSNIIHELTSNHEKYDRLLSKYIIKLVPMINPDGVVIGNSRSSLAGVDLNRRWADPNPVMHPEIYFLKNHMKLVNQQCNGISIFCDLHGHTKAMNTFIYGCNKAPNEGMLSWTKTRLFPKVFASLEPIFDFEGCTFSQEKIKYNTARVVVWNEFKVTNSFTLETSMFGKILKVAQKNRFKMQVSQLYLKDMQCISDSLIQTIVQYTEMEAQLEKEFRSTGGQLKKKKLDEMAGFTARKKQEIEQRDQQQRNKQMALQKKEIELSASKQKQKSPFRSRRSQFGEYEEASLNPTLISNNEQNKNGKNSQNMTPQKMYKHQQSLPQVGAFESIENGSSAKGASKIKLVKNQKISNMTSLDESLNDLIEVSQSREISTESKRNANFNESKNLNQMTQQGEFNWQKFFANNEFENALAQSKKPIVDVKSSSKNEKQIQESDSEPSCDNFEEDELLQRFEAAYSDDDKQHHVFKKASNMSVLEDQAQQKKSFDFKFKKKVVPTPKLHQIPIAKTSINQQSMHFTSIQKELNNMVKNKPKKLSQRFDQLQKQINVKIEDDQSRWWSESKNDHIQNVYQNESLKNNRRGPIPNCYSVSMKPSQFIQGDNFGRKVNDISPMHHQSLKMKYGGQTDVRRSMDYSIHDKKLSMVSSPQQLKIKDKTNYLYKYDQNLKVPQAPNIDISVMNSTIPNLPQIQKPQKNLHKNYRVINRPQNSQVDTQTALKENDEGSVNTASLEDIKSHLSRGYDQDLSGQALISYDAYKKDRASQAQNHKNIARRAKRDFELDLSSSEVKKFGQQKEGNKLNIINDTHQSSNNMQLKTINPNKIHNYKEFQKFEQKMNKSFEGQIEDLINCKKIDNIGIKNGQGRNIPLNYTSTGGYQPKMVDLRNIKDYVEHYKIMQQNINIKHIPFQSEKTHENQAKRTPRYVNPKHDTRQIEHQLYLSQARPKKKGEMHSIQISDLDDDNLPNNNVKVGRLGDIYSPVLLSQNDSYNSRGPIMRSHILDQHIVIQNIPKQPTSWQNFNQQNIQQSHLQARVLSPLKIQTSNAQNPNVKYSKAAISVTVSPPQEFNYKAPPNQLYTVNQRSSKNKSNRAVMSNWFESNF